MNALIINCSPVRNGATAEIESIEHFYGHMEIESCGRLGLCLVENKSAVEKHKVEIEEFCGKIMNG